MLCAQGTGQSRGYAATHHGQNIYIAGVMYALCLASPVSHSCFLLLVSMSACAQCVRYAVPKVLLQCMPMSYFRLPLSLACMHLTRLSLTRDWAVNCGRLGNFSFATKHVDGTYSDHAGVRTADHHDTFDTVTNHHFTGSGESRVGMDLTISKVSAAGLPDAVVFAADLVPHGKEVDNETSTRTYGYMTGIASFAASGLDQPVVVAVGSYVGDLTVPMAVGPDKMFPNPKFQSWDYNGIVLCRRQGTSPGQAAVWPRLAGASGSRGT